MNKVYVDVVAEFRKDGQLVPIFFTWEDGRKYSIDRILKIERCAGLWREKQHKERLV